MRQLRFSPERSLALSDGVYAIVLTLLVLDLKVPGTSGLSELALEQALLGQTSNFVAYLICFFAVGKLWIDHHAIFYHIQHINQALLWANYLHLLFVSLLPFSASLIGRFEGNHLAQLLFFFNLTLSGLSLSWIWIYSIRLKFTIIEQVSMLARRHHVIRTLLMPALALLAAAVSFLHSTSAYLCWLAAPLLVYYLNHWLKPLSEPDSLG